MSVETIDEETHDAHVRTTEEPKVVVKPAAPRHKLAYLALRTESEYPVAHKA